MKKQACIPIARCFHPTQSLSQTQEVEVEQVYLIFILYCKSHCISNVSRLEFSVWLWGMPGAWEQTWTNPSFPTCATMGTQCSACRRVKKPHYESMYKTQQSSLVTQCRKLSSDHYLGSKLSGKYKIAKSKQNPRIIFPRPLKILAANVIPRISKPLFDVTVSWFATSRLQGNSHDISLTPTTCWSTLELSLHLALETILLILLI